MFLQNLVDQLESLVIIYENEKGEYLGIWSFAFLEYLMMLNEIKRCLLDYQYALSESVNHNLTTEASPCAPIRITMAMLAPLRRVLDNHIDRVKETNFSPESAPHSLANRLHSKITTLLLLAENEINGCAFYPANNNDCFEVMQLYPEDNNKKVAARLFKHRNEFIEWVVTSGTIDEREYLLEKLHSEVLHFYILNGLPLRELVKNPTLFNKDESFDSAMLYALLLIYKNDLETRVLEKTLFDLSRFRTGVSLPKKEKGIHYLLGLMKQHHKITVMREHLLPEYGEVLDKDAEDIREAIYDKGMFWHGVLYLLVELIAGWEDGKSSFPTLLPRAGEGRC